MNGRELAERLIAQSPQLKCVYITGYEGGKLGQQGFTEQGANLLLKPFTCDHFARKVPEAFGVLSQENGIRSVLCVRTT